MGENSLLTTGGSTIRIPAKEKPHPFIGHFAPEIQLRDHRDRLVSLHATIALGRPIVLYFFPLAGSPHCTKESCSFRDALVVSPVFNDLNAIVIGISQDPTDRQKKFVDEHHLNFRVLHDVGRETMNAWGVGRTMLGLVDARCTFIIDHQGIVRAMAAGVWDYLGHLRFAERWLMRIENELAGRERFYLLLSDDEFGAEPAGNDGEARIRVVYGKRASSGGVGIAPRYGAAAQANKSKRNSGGNRGSSGVGELREASSPSSSSSISSPRPNGGTALKSSKSRKSLREWFSPRQANHSGAFDESLDMQRSAADGAPPTPLLSSRDCAHYSRMACGGGEASTFGSSCSSEMGVVSVSSTADTSVDQHHSRTFSENPSVSKGPASHVFHRREARIIGPSHSSIERPSSTDSAIAIAIRRALTADSKNSDGSLGAGGVSHDLTIYGNDDDGYYTYSKADDELEFSIIDARASLEQPLRHHKESVTTSPYEGYRPRMAEASLSHRAASLLPRPQDDWALYACSSSCSGGGSLALDRTMRNALPPLPRPARRGSALRREMQRLEERLEPHEGDRTASSDLLGTRRGGLTLSDTEDTVLVAGGAVARRRSSSANGIDISPRRTSRRRSTSGQGLSSTTSSSSLSSSLGAAAAGFVDGNSSGLFGGLRGLGIVDASARNDGYPDDDEASVRFSTYSGYSSSNTSRRTPRLSRSLPRQSPAPSYAPPQPPTRSSGDGSMWGVTSTPGLNLTPPTAYTSEFTTAATDSDSYEHEDYLVASILEHQLRLRRDPLAWTRRADEEEDEEHEAWDQRSLAESFATFGGGGSPKLA
ncbi:hypothetical protein ACQY0O_008409 [Thecaphora frezii]